MHNSQNQSNQNTAVTEVNPDELSKQLRCPSGDNAQQVADTMYESNANMIQQTLHQLSLNNHARLLEIGFGNGKHLPELMAIADNLYYQGIEISKAMVDEAIANNTELINQQPIQFLQVEETQRLPFEPASFDVCFTVNTVYFWQQPQEYVQQIYHLLATGGMLYITFIDKAFAEKLPLNKQIFNLYETAEITHWLKQAGFKQIETYHFEEEVKSKFAGVVTRPCHVVNAVK